MDKTGSRLCRVAVKPGDSVLVLGDLHAAILDWGAFNLVYNVAVDAKVTHIDVNGDNLDNHTLSRHPKEPDRLMDSVQRESAALGGILWQLTLIKSAHTFHIKPGNHDDRWYDLVAANPALNGVEWYDIPKQHAPDQFDWLPRHAATQYGSVVVEHGDSLPCIKRGGGSTAAARVLASYPDQNTVFGHCHSLDSKVRSRWSYGRQLKFGAWGTGHLSRRDAHRYALDNSFEQGSVIITFHSGPNDFSVETLRVERDSLDKPFINFRGVKYA